MEGARESLPVVDRTLIRISICGTKGEVLICKQSVLIFQELTTSGMTVSGVSFIWVPIFEGPDLQAKCPDLIVGR